MEPHLSWNDFCNLGDVFPIGDHSGYPFNLDSEKRKIGVILLYVYIEEGK
jgi:hypothetical protein